MRFFHCHPEYKRRIFQALSLNDPSVAALPRDDMKGAAVQAIAVSMRFPFLLVLCITLAACAAPPRPMERVEVAPGVALDMPSPADLGRSVESAQLVTARRGDQTFAFEGRLSVSPERLLLVGTDPMGRRAMSIVWRAGTLQVDKANWLPDAVRPENVLADIVLVYWPEDAVRQGLAASGATLETAPGRRAVWKDGREVIAVTYQGAPWAGVAHLENSGWHYRIEIRSAEVGS